MKTLTKAHRVRVVHRITTAPWWLGLALGLAILPGVAHAQVIVKTLGGGPIIDGGPAYGYLDGAALQESQFNMPCGLALDAAGLLYVADRDNGAVRKLNLQSDHVTTLIRGLKQPVALAFGRDDTLYVANYGDGTVRKFDLFGNPLAIYSGLSKPTALDVTGDIVYVTELTGALKRISPEGEITTVTTGFLEPRGLAVLDDNTLAISENHAIRRLNLVTLKADYLAGTNTPGLINGASSLARFNQPHHIARAPNGDLVVADRMNHCVRTVDAIGTTITLYGVPSNLWGSPYPGWWDGDAVAAEAREPVGVAVARDGTVYTTEVFYHLVRRVTTSLAGTNITNVVASVKIAPDGATTNNPVLVTLESPTPDAELWYRVATTNDLKLPIPGGADSKLYRGPFLLDTSGTLFVRGFKSGYLASELARADFKFTVADPVIFPRGATADNPVLVTLTSDTSGAQLRWTIDGQDPTTNSALYAEPFALGTNGTLKVKGFRDGFLPSATVSSAFDLAVSTPNVWPESGTFVNLVTVTLGCTTTNATLHYTLDGSEPTTGSAVTPETLTLPTNAMLKVKAFLDGFKPSTTVAREYRVRVDAPVMSPDRGYYPNGTTLTLAVQRADATIYYTLDGRDPTPQDHSYAGPFTVFSPNSDLRSFRARAFAPGTEPSLIVSGQPVLENTIGVPRDMVAGIGSTIIMPVVVNLTTNDVLRSLQFRVEISPGSPDAPGLNRPLRALDISTNDFIQVAGPAEQGAVAHFSSSTYTLDSTQGIVISAIGTNANFVARHFATVALLAVPIPATASPGNAYTVNVREASATSDGRQQQVTLTPQPPRSITIVNLPYVVGDAALSVWYNAGDFGDRNLDNSDVNSAFYASVGIRVPYDFTDVFNAMDAFPEDAPGVPGGDGQIRYLDWQRVLTRSLRLSTNYWQRAWGPGGRRVALPASLPSLQGLAASASFGTLSLSGPVWYRPALLGAGSVENANPSTTVEVPVYLVVQPGESVAGMQFVATVIPKNGAPPLVEPVLFAPTADTAPPDHDFGTAVNERVCAWDLGRFNPAMTGSNVLGYLRIKLPVDTPFGLSYTAEFSYVDGAPDLYTQYDFETRSGEIWVRTTANTPPDLISDQWKTNFFGSVTNALAAPNADPDGDGLSNLAEYLEGSDPTINDFPLQLLVPELHAEATGRTVVLRWMAVAGRSYTLESTSDLTCGDWTPLATNIIATGPFAEFMQSNVTNTTQFYRVRQKP
jgi:hypothetical protein